MQSFRKKKLAKGAEKNVFHIPLVESVEKPAGNLGKTAGGNRWKKLCQKNIELNNLTDRLKLVCDDIKNWKKHFVAGQFDAVFSNPPYMKGGTGNKQEARNIARHEENLPLEDLVSVAGKLLKEGGSFWCVYCSDRACELIIKLHKERLETKEMLFTENGKGQVARVVLRAVKGGKSGVKIYPNLVTNDSDGKYIEALQTRNFLK